MGDHISSLINRLSDPSIRWYTWSHFGRRVYGNITGTNQTLAICDDMICLPVRFSEYIRWFNPVANSPANRVFNLSEAWDHINETNPTTSYPYDGDSFGVLGYCGYFIPIELTDGSNRVVVHIVRRYNQILIMNMGYYIRDNTRYTINVPVKVLFPPSILGLTYTTNGTVESDGITISSGKYVLFYPSEDLPFSIDTANGIFATSPMGRSKSMDYELMVPSFRWGNVDIPSMYIGVRTRQNAENLAHLVNLIRISFGVRVGINVGGYRDTVITSCIYDSDPYATTWAEYKNIFAYYTGWAEDENGSVKFILASSLSFKHTTRVEIRGEISQTRLHDLDTGETYIIFYTKPSTGMYSYGRAGLVTTPEIVHGMQGTFARVLGWSDASMMVLVKPDDSIEVKTTPAPNTFPYWEWNDGYGACNVWNDKALCFEFIAFYTDDTAVSINPKDQGINRNGQALWRIGFIAPQIKSFMDRTLSQGRTYLCIGRLWLDQGNQPADYYASRIKKYTPRIITPDEWSNLVTFFPPFTLNIIGGAPHLYGRYIEFIIDPPNPKPGQPFTISGAVRLSPSPTSSPLSNAKVIIIIVDPGTNTATLLTSVQADANGRFSVTLNAPETPKNYKILVIARPQT